MRMTISTNTKACRTTTYCLLISCILASVEVTNGDRLVCAAQGTLMVVDPAAT